MKTFFNILQFILIALFLFFFFSCSLIGGVAIFSALFSIPYWVAAIIWMIIIFISFPLIIIVDSQIE